MGVHLAEGLRRLWRRAGEGASPLALPALFARGLRPLALPPSAPQRGRVDRQRSAQRCARGLDVFEEKKLCEAVL